MAGEVRPLGSISDRLLQLVAQKAVVIMSIEKTYLSSDKVFGWGWVSYWARPHTTLRVLPVLLLLVLLSCSPTKAVVSKDVASSSPCSFLKEKTIRQLLGGKPSIPVELERTDVSDTCTYLRANGNKISLVKFGFIKRGMEREEFASLAREVPKGVRTRPVTSIGDLAFWEFDPEVTNGGILSILEGESPLVIQLILPGKERLDPLGEAIRVARAIEKVDQNLSVQDAAEDH